MNSCHGREEQKGTVRVDSVWDQIKSTGERVSRDPTSRACSAAFRSTVRIPADPRQLSRS